MTLPIAAASAAATRRYRFHTRLTRELPDVTAVPVRRHASELLVRVIHVKHFVTQDLFEYRARLRIVVYERAIDREAAGSGFLRDVEEREQRAIGLAVDAQVIETVAAGQWLPLKRTRRSRR